MCGIVGARDDWLRERGLEPAAAMERALANLRWRGPDGTGVVKIGDWWLGCARLAITQPRSHQPVTRRGGRYAAVLNGAITNARELWAELLPRAERRAAPPNDAWLPLLCVEHERRDLLAAMRGHHAFIVVDRDRPGPDQVVHGHDRWGEKPLLRLRNSAGLVAFASTPTAMREVGGPGPAEIMTQFDLGSWFRCGFAPPPAYSVGDIELHAHPATGSIAAPSEPTTLRARLTASVERCTDTTVRVGLALSGGIDSSCLAACLHALGRPTTAYQFHAAGTKTNERELAEQVAATCRLPLVPVDGGPEVLDALPELTRRAGVPLGDPSILAVHALARRAAGDGVRVLLGGEGADELFYGYDRYRALARLPRWRWLRPARRFAPGWSMRRTARLLRAVTGSDPILELAAVTPPAFRESVLPPELEGGTSAAEIPERGRALADLARRRDLLGYLPHDLLPKVDVATMAAGIESRCPFLEDARVDEASAATDLGKQRLRAAFIDALPAAVFAQPKRGFALPLDRWFRGELPWLDLLRDERTLSRPHLRAAGVTAAVGRHRRGAADLGHALYLLVAYEVYLREFE